MNEVGVGGQVQKFDGLRQLKQRRRDEQHIVGERDRRADRASIRRVVIAIGIVRLLLCGGFAVLRDEPLRVDKIGLRQAGLDRRRG